MKYIDINSTMLLKLKKWVYVVHQCTHHAYVNTIVLDIFKLHMDHIHHGPYSLKEIQTRLGSIKDSQLYKLASEQEFKSLYGMGKDVNLCSVPLKVGFTVVIKGFGTTSYRVMFKLKFPQRSISIIWFANGDTHLKISNVDEHLRTVLTLMKE